ncbi:hypothetical protein JL37_14615 [Achromobacter sp. RTa]|uniref:hypothetical protein n=1 Tax=Achromobacter sp. RTa TaxID=1532557 RepID=UPI0005101E10|nr:hypothetical protein [Achromobacter sp. RTa]KGD93674.1 hypothetical protein JL37_14615 [Achromobacter sp. RTa]
MYNRKSLAAFALLAGAGIVVACGPDFPAQLLDNRAGTLRATPANSFGYEAARLISASDALPAHEAYELPDGSDPRNAIPEDYDPALTETQRAVARAMRAQPDGDRAYALGTALPEAARLYTAAAVDTHAADRPDAGRSLEQARARYRAILRLPPRQAAARSVWAAYMLAEIGDELETTAGGADAQRSAAAQAYARVRQLARDGAPDPLGLAVASYGQEARLLLAGPQGLCGYAELANADPCVDAIPAASLKRAISLYAEQAARGSSSGNASLSMLAQWALDEPARARRLIDDPVAQRLLVAYALARVGDIVGGRADSASDVYAAYDVSGQIGYADAAQGLDGITPNPALQSLVAALETQDLSRAPDADRVAALAYRTGRYDLAQTLAARLDTALAWWVRAKLALRQGDTEQAARAYAKAASAFPSADGSLEAPGGARLKGEQGVLTLSRGQYIEALDQLLNATVAGYAADGFWQPNPYWNDAAYVAERVLTIAELKAYVDRQAPATPAPRSASPPPDPANFYEWSRRHPVTASDRLRVLLARRLVREGSIEQALPYFPAASDARYAALEEDGGKWTVRMQRTGLLAAGYGEALRKAANAWGRTARAEAWFEAARLARRDGMEIMGYEQEPDFAVYGGSTTYGAGRNAAPGWQDQNAPTDTPEQRAAAALPGPYVADEERRRYAASEARPYARFHYRQIAANHALRAADELPDRSQAFAAVLCEGARYIIDDSPERASAIYQRYIDRGARVPFSSTFGRECAAPDFKAAAWFHYTQAEKAWERLRRGHPGLLLAAGLLALIAGGAGVLAWRNAAARRTRAG